MISSSLESRRSCSVGREQEVEEESGQLQIQTERKDRGVSIATQVERHHERGACTTGEG